MKAAHLRPLSLFYQETESPTKAIAELLLSLELRVESFRDPKAFLLQIRHASAALCFVDMTSAKTDIPVALIKTIRSIIGHQLPVFALVRKGDGKAAERALALGASLALEWPLSAKELAAKLFKHVATDAISEALRSDLRKSFESEKGVAEAPLPVVELPKIVEWYFEKIAPVLGGLSGALEVFEEVEVQMRHYAERLMGQRQEIENMVRVLRKSKEKLDLLQSLRLYGLANSRNLVAAEGLSEALGGGLFRWNAKTGLPVEEPKSIVAYAQRAVSHFGEGGRYQQVAFNAGLIFDLFTVMANSAGDRKRGLLKIIENSFVDGIGRADRGFRMGKSVKDLVLEKHIVSVLLGREAGKVAMALFFPDYGDLRAKFDKKGLGPIAQHSIEKERYAVSHNLIGALICQVTPALAPAYKSVLFFDYPYMLKHVREDAEAMALARLCKSL